MPANATRPSLLLELTSQFWVRQRRFKRKPRTCASRTISDILLRPRFALAVVAIAAQNLYLVPGAQGQNEDMPCDAFVKNPDGSWTATRAVFVLSANFSVRVGGVFRPGEKSRGYDLAAKLDEVCRNGTAAPPPAAAEEQQPRTPLSQFADSNGNIDVQRLTCGHLADAPSEEAELFLAWHSGSHNRSAKGRAINMARLKYAIRDVVDYCKSHRDESLVKVMQLMSK